jgi:hypothetical protein
MGRLPADAMQWRRVPEIAGRAIGGARDCRESAGGVVYLVRGSGSREVSGTVGLGMGSGFSARDLKAE